MLLASGSTCDSTTYTGGNSLSIFAIQVDVQWRDESTEVAVESQSNGFTSDPNVWLTEGDRWRASNSTETRTLYRTEEAHIYRTRFEQGERPPDNFSIWMAGPDRDSSRTHNIAPPIVSEFSVIPTRDGGRLDTPLSITWQVSITDDSVEAAPSLRVRAVSCDNEGIPEVEALIPLAPTDTSSNIVLSEWVSQPANTQQCDWMIEVLAQSLKTFSFGQGDTPFRELDLRFTTYSKPVLVPLLPTTGQ